MSGEFMCARLIDENNLGVPSLLVQMYEAVFIPAGYKDNNETGIKCSNSEH